MQVCPPGSEFTGLWKIGNEYLRRVAAGTTSVKSSYLTSETIVNSILPVFSVKYSSISDRANGVRKFATGPSMCACACVGRVHLSMHSIRVCRKNKNKQTIHPIEWWLEQCIEDCVTNYRLLLLPLLVPGGTLPLSASCISGQNSSSPGYEFRSHTHAHIHKRQTVQDERIFRGRTALS